MTSTIQQFSEVRADGKLIPEGLPAADIRALSGSPVNVVGAQWTLGGKFVSVSSRFGVLAKVTESRQYVVVVESLTEDQMKTTLKIYRSDGTLSADLGPDLNFEDQHRTGQWTWFAAPRSAGPDRIGIVYMGDWKDSLGYQHSAHLPVDIDAAQAKVVAVYNGR